MKLTGYGAKTPSSSASQWLALVFLGICLTVLPGCQYLPMTADQPVEDTPSQPEVPETPVESTTEAPVAAETEEPAPVPAEAPATAVEDKPAPEPEIRKAPVCPAPRPCPKCPAAKLLDKFVVGEIEEIKVAPPGFVYQARIDTGAEGTSVHATDIVRFERDGDSWVRFNLIHPTTGEPHALEREVVRRIRVRQVELEGFERRLVVMLTLTIGSLNEQTEVSLVDRSDMEFPVLVGRNFLQNLAIVDVSQQMIAK